MTREPLELGPLGVAVLSDADLQDTHGGWCLLVPILVGAAAAAIIDYFL